MTIFFSAVGFGDSLYQKTSAIVSASSKNLTKEQMSSLNQMISKLNENITLMVGGRTLEDFKTNETAVKQVFSSSSWRFCTMSIISDALTPPNGGKWELT